MKTITLMRFQSLALLCVLAACSTGSPLIAYTVDTPPLILMPIAQSSVIDDRGRFREILCAINEERGKNLPAYRPCKDTLHRLAGEPEPTGQPVHLGKARAKLTFAIVAGFASECAEAFISPYRHARPHVEKFGYETTSIRVGGRFGSTHNAKQIRDAVMDMKLAPGGRIVLVGYSKGTADILEAVVLYPEIRDRVVAVASVAGVVAGSPLADAAGGFEKAMLEILPTPCPSGDGLAIESLRRSTRLRWLAKNKLPDDISYFSLAAFADRDHTSSFHRDGYDKLRQIDPRNDGQMIFTDAIIPGSRLLGFANGDHWALALPFWPDHMVLATTIVEHNKFPREVLLEAIVRHVEERLLEDRQRTRRRRPARRVSRR